MTVETLTEDLQDHRLAVPLAPDLTSDDVATIAQADYRAYVARLATRKIKGFCGTIDENGAYYSEVYPGNASLTDSLTADYHGRFLIELIQNANDVHPESRRDGEIEIVFTRAEGKPGTLYIANRGSAFSKKNVNALCDMGLSSKPPGESIGNKGLGFRSVHHISDCPLVYSQAGAPINPIQFDGFCFGFADETDLDVLIANPRNRALAKRDLPLFHVPKWLDDQPEVIREFARRGFATVIALPLRDASAAEAVENEIAAIRNQKVPLLLFLTRLQRLTVRVVAADCDPQRDFSLARSEVPVSALNVMFTLVDLDNAGRFLVARRQVPEASMKAAIKDGTDKKQLHKHWLKWEGTGDVALAVRLDGLVATPRLFTFLPMGEQATAPFAGYLHGTFFPTSNRKGLDASIKLNALLLNEATTLAAATIACLTQSEAVGHEHGLDSETKARAVCDFLSWRNVDSLETKVDLAGQVAGQLAKQLAASAFDDAPVIPCLVTRDGKPTVAWCPPSHARRWRYELESFSAVIVAAYSADTRIAPIWPGLGPRIDRLNAYLTKYAPRYVELPTALERADLATMVASELAANRRTSIGRWVAYYRDLAILLDKVGGSLAGRRLLLCTDGKLHRTMTPTVEPEGQARRRHRQGVEASVFSPPARRSAGSDGADQLTPPINLVENFAFLSNRLDWYGELASARLFLENAKLVFAFDREVVLAQLSRALRQDGRNSVRGAGLRWAFHIWRQPRETGRAFKLQAQHRFFVPTIDGEFIEAGDAVFSESWPDETRGRLLQRFLNSAPPDIDDLKRLSSRRLAPRSDYAFRGSKVDIWVEFLVELGVQQGLRPVAKKVTPSTVRADRLVNFSFCGDLGISPSAATAWKADIDANQPGATRLPYYTDYVVRGDVWWLPGQGDIDRFSRDCREYYAMLIIAWLGQTTLPPWTIQVHHYHFTNADTRDWPTPVAAFLRSAPWIPADEPSSEGLRPVFVRPSEIWLAPEGGNERFPTFLRRPAVPVLRILERAGQDLIKTLQSRARLRMLNQAATLIQQAIFLTQQYDRNGFERYYTRYPKG